MSCITRAGSIGDDALMRGPGGVAVEMLLEARSGPELRAGGTARSVPEAALPEARFGHDDPVKRQTRPSMLPVWDGFPRARTLE